MDQQDPLSDSKNLSLYHTENHHLDTGQQHMVQEHN